VTRRPEVPPDFSPSCQEEVIWVADRCVPGVDQLDVETARQLFGQESLAAAAVDDVADGRTQGAHLHTAYGLPHADLARHRVKAMDLLRFSGATTGDLAFFSLR